jgi:hypothetical protein
MRDASTEPRSGERGDQRPRPVGPQPGRASTEPRSGERGDTAAPGTDTAADLLQRSRAFDALEE